MQADGEDASCGWDRGDPGRRFKYHTAEGGADESALSFRGLADDTYHRSDPSNPSRYIDTKGTGNSVDAGRPEVLRLILDCLRYWVLEMHVDGFRFDLASALARQHGYVDRLSAFFTLIYQDPVLANVKLIAERNINPQLMDAAGISRRRPRVPPASIRR